MLPVRLPRATRALRACGRAACLPALLLHAYQYALSSWCGVVWAEGGKEATGVQVAHSPICSPRMTAPQTSPHLTHPSWSSVRWPHGARAQRADLGRCAGGPAGDSGRAVGRAGGRAGRRAGGGRHPAAGGRQLRGALRPDTRARALRHVRPALPWHARPALPRHARPALGAPARRLPRAGRWAPSPGREPGRWRGEVGAWAEGGVALGVPGL